MGKFRVEYDAAGKKRLGRECLEYVCPDGQVFIIDAGLFLDRSETMCKMLNDVLGCERKAAIEGARLQDIDCAEHKVAAGVQLSMASNDFDRLVNCVADQIWQRMGTAHKSDELSGADDASYMLGYVIRDPDGYFVQDVSVDFSFNPPYINSYRPTVKIKNAYIFRSRTMAKFFAHEMSDAFDDKFSVERCD